MRYLAASGLSGRQNIYAYVGGNPIARHDRSGLSATLIAPVATQCVALAVELSPDEAWALAEFLKRAGYSDYRALAISDTEASAMQAGAERLRQAVSFPVKWTVQK